MNKISLFLKLSFAALAGATDKVIGLKNYKKAVATIKAQIAQLNFKQVEDEQAVENAEEALSSAKYPNELIADGKVYLSKIHAADDRLKQAKAALKATVDSIAYNEALLAEFDTQVDSDEDAAK